MASQAASSPTHKSLDLLSRLLLLQANEDTSTCSVADELRRDLVNLRSDEFEDLLALANSNHVVIRGLETFLSAMRDAQDDARAEWAETALGVERARIAAALPFLQAICRAFEEQGYDITVIKSLDHWPDLGSDLDLYTNAGQEEVSRLMKRLFRSQIAPRSWGDRLAHKWNFLLPGLPEAVEIHIGRLGQTGEQVAIASSLAGRARTVLIGEYAFRVPSRSDRLMISTLQRMYRHFYFRLCDIVDTTALLETEGIDYNDLRDSARAAGIWEGVATYLAIVSDYVKRYRGSGIDLPQSVIKEARFRGDAVYYGRGFLRVPIMPQSACLYGSQLAGVLRKLELSSCARLSLLPWLATAAAVGQKITGSDKGIW
jgi:hypothetical protein